MLLFAFWGGPDGIGRKWGGQHLAPEGRKIGKPPPPSDVFDTFPYYLHEFKEGVRIGGSEIRI